MTIRTAHPGDREAIAELHISNMQQTYRPFLSERYLEDEMPAERRTRWLQRFASGLMPSYLVRVAESANELAGFVCLVIDPSDRWGTLIDGLHVSPRHQRQGLGQRLLAAAITDLDAGRSRIPMHLLVYEDNFSARRLYDTLGGEVIEKLTRDIGLRGDVVLLRYAWENPATLLNALHG